MGDGPHRREGVRAAGLERVVPGPATHTAAGEKTQPRERNIICKRWCSPRLEGEEDPGAAVDKVGVGSGPDQRPGDGGGLIRETEARRFLKKDYFLALHTADNIKANIQAQKKS